MIHYIFIQSLRWKEVRNDQCFNRNIAMLLSKRETPRKRSPRQPYPILITLYGKKQNPQITH